MPRAALRDAIYRRRRYSAELIEQCVRWYLTYRLSYRDLFLADFAPQMEWPLGVLQLI